MALNASTRTVVRITSAQKFTERTSFTEGYDCTHPSGVPQPRRPFRQEDPPERPINEIGPDDLGKRIVIRSGGFLGTVCGTLVGVNPHRNLVAFTTIQLFGKKALTFRNDTEVVVLD